MLLPGRQREQLMLHDHAHIFIDHTKHLSFLRGAAEEARQTISRSLSLIHETQILLQEIERLHTPLISQSANNCREASAANRQGPLDRYCDGSGDFVRVLRGYHAALRPTACRSASRSLMTRW